MAQHANSFDFILNTVAAQHDLNPFIALLKRDGNMTLVGAPEHDHPAPQVFNLILKRRSIAGSLIGGIAETRDAGFLRQARHHFGYRADRHEPNQRRLRAHAESDVKYRFVIDINTLREESAA